MYLWFALIGWAVFFLFVTVNTVAFFWAGSVLAIGLALTAIFTSAVYIARGPKDIIIHGVAWTVAVALGFLAGLFIYAVISGV
jgi:hypothetical protein